MTRLEHALSLAKQGFRVFPLRRNDKRPAIPNWISLATTDEAQIRKWWSPDPAMGTPDERNVGIATGNGLVVIDVDVRAGEAAVASSLAQLSMIYDFDVDAPHVTTASGGRHYYLSSDERLRNRIKLLPGIDVKSTGGYVVAPGSEIGGKRYEGSVERRPMPPALAEMVGAARERPEGEAGGGQALVSLDNERNVKRFKDEVVAHWPPAVEGADGYASTRNLSARGGDYGLSPEATVEALAEWNAECSPPWEPEELLELARSMQRSRATPMGSALPEVAAAELVSDDPVRVRELVDAWLAEPPAPARERYKQNADFVDNRSSGGEGGTDEAPRPRGRILPLVEAIDFVDPPMLVKDYLTAGALSVVYGPSNAGKSFVALDMALCVATGLPWDGRETQRGAVVYAALEGGVGIRKRLAAWCVDKGVDAASVPLGLFVGGLDLLSKKSVDAFVEDARAWAEGHSLPLGLIVVDTLSRAMAGGDENAPSDMTKAVGACDAIRAATGAHLTLIHHSGKDIARGARGHSSLRAAVDTEIEVAENTIAIAKQRDMEFAPPRAFRLVDVALGLERKSAVVRYERVVEKKDVQVELTEIDKEWAREIARAAEMAGFSYSDDKNAYTANGLAENCNADGNFKFRASEIERVAGKRRNTSRRSLERLQQEGILGKTLDGQWVMLDCNRCNTL